MQPYPALHFEPWTSLNSMTLCYIATSLPLCSKLQVAVESHGHANLDVESLPFSLGIAECGQSYSIMLNLCCCFSDDIRRQRKHNILALKGLCFNISLPLSLLSVITRRDACRKWVGEWIHEGCTAFSDITGFPVFFPGRISTLVLSPCGAGRRSHPNQSVHYCTLYPFWYPVFLPTRIRYSGTYSACLLSFPDFVAAQSIRIALG